MSLDLPQTSRFQVSLVRNAMYSCPSRVVVEDTSAEPLYLRRWNDLFRFEQSPRFHAHP